jgi:hypothetical protein
MKIRYLGYENWMWKAIVIAFARVVTFRDQLSMQKNTNPDILADSH